MIWSKNWLLLGGLFLIIVGIGVYFAKDFFIGVLPGSQNFLSQLSAVVNTDALLGKKSPENANPAESAKNSVVSIKNCSFGTAHAPKHNSVILNEIAWMGTPDSANNEWIELKNISSEPADLGGWQLLNENEKIKVVFGGGVNIPPEGFYLLERGSADFLPGVKADKFYSGAMRNSGEGLRFFDSNCSLADEALADVGTEKNWPAGDNAAKKTMERDLQTLAWYTSALAGGTPKKENTAPPKPLAAAQTIFQQQSATSANTTAAATTTASQAATNQPPLCSPNSPRTFSHSALINEVAWAGVSSDKTSQEWIELKNNAALKISLDGWQLQNQSQNIKVFFGTSDSISVGGFYLLERGNADFLPNVKADKFFTNTIKNSDESLLLFDKDCNIVDEVSANVGSGKDWPAGTTSPDYRTAERSSDLSWRTYSGNGSTGSPQVFGTPRAENSSVPEIIVSNSPPPSLTSSAESSSQTSSPTSSETSVQSSTQQSSPPPSTSSLARSNVNHILISQIQITGGSGQTTNDFIEIYNPTGAQSNLKGYRLVKRSASSTTDTSIKSWTSDTFIPAYGFYLWANSAYTTISITPDATTTVSIADNNGIAIRSGSENTGEIIDAVAWGNFQNVLFEGTAFSTNPGANQSILRKSWQQNTCVAASFDASIGNGCDTNNNASDFELKSSQPRNSQTR